MKTEIKLIFDEDEDASKEMKSMLDGKLWGLVLWELDQEFRSILKYSDQKYIDIEIVRDKISDKLKEYGLSFEDIL